MKRTELKRHTRLERRTPMKPISDKRRKQQDEHYRSATTKVRRAWVDFGTRCDGCDRPASEVHEITAGSHKHRAMLEPRAQMYVCRRCHDRFQGIPYDRQAAQVTLAVITAINLCHGSNAICIEDVIKELRNGHQ